MHHYFLKRFNEDEEKRTNMYLFGFFIHFAEIVGWQRDVEKNYLPDGCGSYIFIDKDEVQLICEVVQEGLRELSMGRNFINDWDDDQTIEVKTELKSAYSDAAKNKWFDYLKEMVAYLLEHADISYGLFIIES